MKRPVKITHPVTLQVTIDDVTWGRLLRLSEVCRGDPLQIAASLLHDILEDDEETNCIKADVGEPITPRLN